MHLGEWGGSIFMNQLLKNNRLFCIRRMTTIIENLVFKISNSVTKEKNKNKLIKVNFGLEST